jgi:hypothetical protein
MIVIIIIIIMIVALIHNAIHYTANINKFTLRARNVSPSK